MGITNILVALINTKYNSVSIVFTTLCYCFVIYYVRGVQPGGRKKDLSGLRGIFSFLAHFTIAYSPFLGEKLD